MGEGEEFVCPLRGAAPRVVGDGLHQLEVGAHVVGETSHAAQLGHQVNHLGRPRSHVARLALRHQHRLVRVFYADSILLQTQEQNII